MGNDPRWMTNEAVSPEKWLFLNGQFQISDVEAVEDSEALVHPPMFVHEEPERVAIFNSPDGSILREVLKHDTVEEFDAEYRKEFPEYDIPYDKVASSLFNGLDTSGVIGIGLGGAPTIHDPKPDFTADPVDASAAEREKLINAFENHEDTAAMFVYEEAHSGLDEPLAFLIVCNEVEGDFELRTIEEGTKTKNSVTALFARTDISEGSYILPSSMATSFILNGNSLSNLQNNLKIDGTGDMTVIDNFLSYVDDYGHESMSEGSEISIVEVGASQWMVRNENKSESNVGRWMPDHPSGKIPKFSPVYDRHMLSFDVFIVATKDIKKGEELVMHEWSDYS